MSRYWHPAADMHTVATNEVVMDRVRAELFDREHRTDGQQRWQGTEI